MGFTALVLCLFVLHCQAEGDVREKTLYVKTGTDLLLDVGEPVTLNENELYWNFNSKENIVRIHHTNEIVPYGTYVGRIELFPQNQSLLLKNVQKNDSGEYRAVGFINFNDRDLVKYQVTVLDSVSDVKLEVKQCSSDRSDLTVTCTTLDGLLSSTFICENTTCSHEGGEKNIPPGALMKVYLKNGSVTCNHSNQVSSKEDTKTIEELCGKDARNSALNEDDDPSKIYVPVAVTLVIIFVVACVAAVYYRHCRQQRRTWRWENTGTAELQALQGDINPEQGPRNDAQGEPPNSIYVLAGAPAAASTQTPMETNVPPQPESLYATVDKTTKL